MSVNSAKDLRGVFSLREISASFSSKGEEKEREETKIKNNSGKKTEDLIRSH